ncbi:hypothetical protein B0A48_17081 [Cryoendolithus antarcticus]|uniref:BTB domain-containing protein n=1 Tax=Cryoendolithus antarcticus TaxID=1507870 RepID=A0A1V8SBE1_9PEZI|nr:hypothetical protein B0A48_17081 [Cryoendolithus antarcticus]
MALPSSNTSNAIDECLAKRKRTFFDYPEAVNVLVGKDSETRPIGIDKDKICANSKFFKAACSAAWAEGQAGLVKLPEADPKMFLTYTHWIMTGELELTAANWDSKAIRNELLACYTLADRMDDKALRNHTITGLYSEDTVLCWLVRTDCVTAVYDQTSSGSTLRKILVAQFVGQRTTGSLQVEKFPYEFVRDVACKALDVPMISDESFKDRLPRMLE